MLSPTPSATPVSSPAAAQLSPNTSSIFNNPDQGSSSAPQTPETAFSNSGVRVQSFSTRRLLFADTSKSNDPAVKEVDDPTTTPSSDKIQGSSRAFAAPSPQNTYGQNGRCNSYRGSDLVKLEDFLYTRGFQEGACSDVTIIAFGTRYRLHRLILDRSPFFSSCFNGGPWAESESSEITLSPETADQNIEQHAFELALARLYGHVDQREEDKHAMPLLAAASYLELQDLAESCVSSLLRNLKTSGMADIIRFVTNSYYGPLTDRLLGSAKSLLYRDGWEMKFSDWDGISGEVVAEIAGYEGFYVPNEYLRYCFVRDLINWRARESYGPRDSPVDDKYMKVPKAPESQHSFGRDGDASDSVSTIDDDDADIKPLRDLLETGIYYIHMTFEELQRISEDTDILGRPTVCEKTIKDALWQQMILRQTVLNAPNDSAELGISRTEYILAKSPRRSKSPIGSLSSKLGGINGNSPLDLFQMGEKTERKYLIPIEDSSTRAIGDCPEPTSQVSVSGRGHRRGTPSVNDSTPDPDFETKEPDASEEIRFSEFPPFRFSAEFRYVGSLKERKRVYSKTFFYAGSYWNIYIQKVKTTKNIQLGVYLHRAKDRDGNGSSGSPGNRESEQLLGIINTNQKSEAEDGDTTTLDGDTTFSIISSPPGANTSASRSLPGGNVTSSSPVPALGHYVDSRPMIQTYFKIFSPSRKGKMLSMFSSRPDSFNFSQSWGWKSSSLITDDGLVPIDGNDKDARLRFMVVLGNV